MFLLTYLLTYLLCQRRCDALTTNATSERSYRLIMHFVHGGTDTERYMQMSLYLLAFRLQFLNKLELSLYTVYSAFESTLNSSIVSYRMSWVESTYSTAFSRTNSRPGLRSSDTAVYVRPRCRTRFRQRGLEQSSRPPPQISNARPSLFKRRLKSQNWTVCKLRYIQMSLLLLLLLFT